MADSALLKSPVPGHVSVKGFGESDSTPTLSPVTLASSPGNRLLWDSKRHEPKRISRNFDLREDEFIEKKSGEIFTCLNGINLPASARNSSCGDFEEQEKERVVDLWHLRQLAISRGGLLNPSLRKRAWLKLVDANENILTATMRSSIGSTRCPNEASTPVAKLTDDEINLIKADIERNCIWNIEAEIKASRRLNHLRNKVTFEKRVTQRQQVPSDDLSSIGSFGSGTSSTRGGRITPQLIPESIRAFPRNSVRINTDIPRSPLCSAPGSPPGFPSIKPIGERRFPAQSRRRNEEISLLLNIITSVLRTVPKEMKRDLGVEKLYYFQGMHNVAAPMLVTLESPSLTSLVINRLSQCHFRDSMAPTFTNIQALIRAIFMPLLKLVDSSLHEILTGKGILDPCAFALPWIVCWFANDIANYEVIGRLFDVFLASHYSLPIYMSVAMLTDPSNRSRIEMALQSGAGLGDVLLSLPSTIVVGRSRVESMDAIENIIETSVSYITSHPPATIMCLARDYPSNLISQSISVIDDNKFARDIPPWAFKSCALTDWTLIKEVRAMRDLSPESRIARQQARQERSSKIEGCAISPFQYEVALGASGLDEVVKSTMRGRERRTWSTRDRCVMVVLFLVFATTSCTLYGYFRVNNKNVDIVDVEVNNAKQMNITGNLPLDESNSKQVESTSTAPMLIVEDIDTSEEVDGFNIHVNGESVGESSDVFLRRNVENGSLTMIESDEKREAAPSIIVNEAKLKDAKSESDEIKKIDLPRKELKKSKGTRLNSIKKLQILRTFEKQRLNIIHFIKGIKSVDCLEILNTIKNLSRKDPQFLFIME